MKAANPLMPGINAPVIGVVVQRYLLDLLVSRCGKIAVKPNMAATVI
jgi:hypothetical protein